MKLIISIINNDDSSAVISALTREGFRMTKLASTGEFLREGNTTVLIGTQDDKVQQALDIIKKFSSTRVKKPEHKHHTGELSFLADVAQVSVGGAVVFIVDVEQFIKF